MSSALPSDERRGSMLFDSPADLLQFDWERVSSREMQSCFDEMVRETRRTRTLGVSSPAFASPLSGPETQVVLPGHGHGLLNIHCGELAFHAEQKKHKLQQLVILQEVWARMGTDRPAFFLCLSLLQTMKLLDLQGLHPHLYEAFHSPLTRAHRPDGLPPRPGGPRRGRRSSVAVEPAQGEDWYEIVEDIIERLPADIPLMMTSDSPLSVILEQLGENVAQMASPPRQSPDPGFLRGEKMGPTPPQATGKLMSLLKQSRFLNDFEPQEFLGKGGFGTVLKARHRSEDLCYAIKVIGFRDFAVPSKRFQRVFREVTTLARLDHVNVVRYYSAWLEHSDQYEDLLHSLRGQHGIPELDEDEEDEEEEEEEEEETASGFLDSSLEQLEHLLETDMSLDSVYESCSDGNEEEDDEEEGDDEDDGDTTPSIPTPTRPTPHRPPPSSAPSFTPMSSRAQRTASPGTEEINIYGGGSAEVGFYGRETSHATGSKPSPFRKPSLWRTESSYHLPVRSPRRSMAVSTSRVNEQFSPSVAITPTRRGRTRSGSVGRTRGRGVKPSALTGKAVVSTNSHSLIHAEQLNYTLFIQMQLYEHSTLKKWLHDPARVIDKKQCLHILLQIVAGLQHVHEHGLLHRDLKPANIFMSKEGIIKIGDFGLSRNLQSQDNEDVMQEEDRQYKAFHRSIFKRRTSWVGSDQTSSIGTPGYVAPEITKGSTYGPEVDVYSLGIILLELFTKPTTKHERAINLMSLRERKLVPSIQHNYPDIGEMILSLTEPDPTKRMKLDELARIVDYALDDYKHLRSQIDEQQAEINRLQLENAMLKQLCQEHGILLP